MKIFKKLYIVITIFVLVLGTLFVQPKKAQAVLGIADISFDMPTIIKEFGIDTLTTILQQRILNKLIDDTVNWAAGGFDGEPGFVNNWDGFLEGVGHDVISGALQTAERSFNDAQGQANEITEDDIFQCELQVQSDYPLSETSQEDCALRYDQYLNDFEGCVYGLDPIEDELLYEACENERDAQEIAWDTCIDTIGIYNEKLEACQQVGSGLFGDLGNVAQQNYNLYQSGETVNARAAFGTIVKHGGNQLNIDPVTAIIQGEADTLGALLGTQENVQDFANDIGIGPWPYTYGTLGGSNPSQEEALLVAALGKKTLSKITSVKEDLGTPQKFLDKTICFGQKDDEGNCLGREETATPGTLVEAETQETVANDKKQSRIARELSDVLASALGRLATGLLNQGLSNITGGSGGNTGGGSVQQENDFSGVYQNEYDVLGINNDTGGLVSGGENLDGGIIDSGTGSGIEFITGVGDDASTPYVGGPEDLEGLAWNEGPELIVEIKGNLEKSIQLTEEAIDLNIDIKSKILSIQEQVVTLDHCRPGPDYGWEQRYKDKAQNLLSNVKKTDEEVECGDKKQEMQTNFYDIGLPLTKSMNIDPAINVPGANQASETIELLLGDDQKQAFENQQAEIDEQKSIYNILLFMREETKISFEDSRDAIDSRLSLFSEDIDELSNQDLIDLLSLDPINNGNSNFESGNTTYLVESEGIYIFRNGETPTSLVQNSPEKAKELLLDLAWNIWRDREIGADRETKSKLRYQYYILRNDLIKEKDVLELKIKLQQTEDTADRIVGYAGDCRVFLENVGGKTDSQIKTLLENEYALWSENPESSIFETSLYISPANIETSILRFEDRDAVVEYFNRLYPDVEISAYSIAEILEQDETIRTILPEGSGTISTDIGINPFAGVGTSTTINNPNLGKELFCETPRHDRINRCFRGSHTMQLCNTSGSTQGQTWYYGRALNYKSAFAGV